MIFLWTVNLTPMMMLFLWPIHCRWKLKFLFPIVTYFCLNPNSEMYGYWPQTCNFTLSQPTVHLFSHIERQQRIIWAYGDSFEYMHTHNWLILLQPTCNQPSWFPHLFHWWNSRYCCLSSQFLCSCLDSYVTHNIIPYHHQSTYRVLNT